MSAIARSPIAPAAPVAVVEGWEVSQRRSAAALRLSDQSPLAKVLVKADAHGAFTARHATPFGRADLLAGGVLQVGSDPGSWLLIGPPGSATAIISEQRSAVGDVGELVTVIDLTHGRALMRLSGSDSVALLAKLCAIDLSDAITPNHSAFRSSVAKLATDVVRHDLADGTRSYLMHCERSSGQHLFDCVLDAGAEFGIDVDGWS